MLPVNFNSISLVGFDGFKVVCVGDRKPAYSSSIETLESFGWPICIEWSSTLSLSSIDIICIEWSMRYKLGFSIGFVETVLPLPRYKEAYPVTSSDVARSSYAFSLSGILISTSNVSAMARRIRSTLTGITGNPSASTIVISPPA